VNFLPGAFVYNMSPLEMPHSEDKIWAPSGEVESVMACSHASFGGKRTPVTAEVKNDHPVAEFSNDHESSGTVIVIYLSQKGELGTSCLQINRYG
jgi:hypothetical protein